MPEKPSKQAKTTQPQDLTTEPEGDPQDWFLRPSIYDNHLCNQDAPKPVPATANPAQPQQYATANAQDTQDSA